MSLLIKHRWDDTTVKWLETNHIQVAICNKLRHHPLYGVSFDFAARFNEAKRSAGMVAMQKLAGLVAGEPDLQLYFERGKVVHIELKAKDTPVSKVQIKRHEQLRRLGHDVYLVRASCPQDGVDQVMRILWRYVG